MAEAEITSPALLASLRRAGRVEPPHLAEVQARGTISVSIAPRRAVHRERDQGRGSSSWYRHPMHAIRRWNSNVTRPGGCSPPPVDGRPLAAERSGASNVCSPPAVAGRPLSSTFRIMWWFRFRPHPRSTPSILLLPTRKPLVSLTALMRALGSNRAEHRGHHGETCPCRGGARVHAHGLRRAGEPLNPAFSSNPAADACAHGREGHVAQRPDPDAGL